MKRRLSVPFALTMLLVGGCQGPLAGSPSGGVDSPSPVTSAEPTPPSPTSPAAPSTLESPSPSLALALEAGEVDGLTFGKPAGWTTVGGAAPETAALVEALRAAQETAGTELLAPGVVAAEIEGISMVGTGAVAFEPASMGVDGALVVTVIPNDALPAADRSLPSLETAVTAQLDAMEPTERTDPETISVPLGESVRASATMSSGHVVHRAGIVGSSAVYQVVFVTKLTADESDQVFEVILSSINDA